MTDLKFRVVAGVTLSTTILACLPLRRAVADPSASVAAGAASSQPSSQAASSVKIDNFAFKPEELTVAVGTRVSWHNSDDVPHTATSTAVPQVFDSGPLDTDGQYSFTFAKAGIYPYYCKVHPHMKGTVVVK